MLREPSFVRAACSSFPSPSFSHFRPASLEIRKKSSPVLYSLFLLSFTILIHLLSLSLSLSLSISQSLLPLWARKHNRMPLSRRERLVTNFGLIVELDSSRTISRSSTTSSRTNHHSHVVVESFNVLFLLDLSGFSSFWRAHASIGVEMPLVDRSLRKLEIWVARS